MSLELIYGIILASVVAGIAAFAGIVWLILWWNAKKYKKSSTKNIDLDKKEEK